jgi:hypothetical protein
MGQSREHFAIAAPIGVQFAAEFLGSMNSIAAALARTKLVNQFVCVGRSLCGAEVKSLIARTTAVGAIMLRRDAVHATIQTRKWVMPAAGKESDSGNA